MAAQEREPDGGGTGGGVAEGEGEGESEIVVEEFALVDLDLNQFTAWQEVCVR